MRRQVNKYNAKIPVRARPLDRFYSCAGVIGNVVAGARQHIEYAGLAAVRVAGQGNGYFFQLTVCHIPPI